MRTTTIRVDVETHRRLLELSAASGASLMLTVRAATEALRRRRFAERAISELAALREDPSQWTDYLADAETTAVRDGIDR